MSNYNYNNIRKRAVYASNMSPQKDVKFVKTVQNSRPETHVREEYIIMIDWKGQSREIKFESRAAARLLDLDITIIQDVLTNNVYENIIRGCWCLLTNTSSL